MLFFKPFSFTVRPRRRVDAVASACTNASTSTTEYNAQSWPRRSPPNLPPDHFHLPKADMSLLISTVRGGLAERNVFIPLLAKQLQESAETDDINDVFLKTHQEMAKQVPDQIPHYESTKKYKLNLRLIFKRQKRASTFADLSICPVQ